MTTSLRPLITEKAVMLIEAQNTLTFKAGKEADKPEVKKEIESLFKVKIKSIRSQVRRNQKYFYVKLKPEFQAIDIATKVGMI